MTSTHPDPAPTYTEEDVAALFHPETSDAKVPAGAKLALPVCLPQVNTSYDSPIVRAYAPSLEACGISEEDWLRFVEGLNVALIASPPLQIVNTVGMVIGFVPNEWAMIASIAIQTVSQTAQHVISKTLTDKYLRKTNETFFAPRGLKVRLCTTSAMKALVSHSVDQGSKLKTAGAVAYGVSLRLPVIRKIVNRVAPPVPAITSSNFTGETVTSRQLAEVEGLVAPLNFDVRPPKSPEGVMDKMSALSVKLRVWNEMRGQKKADLKRERLAAYESGNMAGMNWRDLRSAAKVQRRAERRARWTGRSPAEFARPNFLHLRKLKTKAELADRKEWAKRGRGLWLCVLTEEEDNAIQDRELADSPDDEVLMDDADWEELEELEYEYEEAMASEEVKKS